MDTTTVNYAIDKLTKGFQAIAPTVQNISEKYVHFVVMKIIVLFFMCLLTIPVVISLFIFAFKMAKKSNTLNRSYAADGPEIITIITYVVAIILTIVGCVSIPRTGYSAIIAYTNPEMYTIQQVIEKVQK